MNTGRDFNSTQSFKLKKSVPKDYSRELQAMPVKPIQATDYVSLAQLNGAGKLNVSKLSNNPADFPTTREVMSTNPAKIEKISPQIPGDFPSTSEVASANPANVKGVSQVAAAAGMGSAVDINA